MSGKKAETQPPEEKPDTKTKVQTPRERLQLFVGVNFTALGDEKETRIEPSVIDLSVLPTAFENELIKLKKARVVVE
jgi:hypothetical protein